MQMTKLEFHAESTYAVTMSHVLNMLRNGLITPEEYKRMNDRMKEKYHPVSDGLIFETDLQLIEKRATMSAGKEA